MIYALGRGLEPSDMPVVRSIVRDAARDNYAMQSIVLGIVAAPRSRCGPSWIQPGPRPAVARATAAATKE